jgi:hypothetical protein
LAVGALASLGVLAGCSPYRPPFTQAAMPTSVVAAPASGEATVVFLWPEASCDPPGFVTLATGDGRFVGNLIRGSQISARIPAGPTTIVGWDDLMEEVSQGTDRTTVPVLHAELAAGRTYYVRLAFGEWDARGPLERDHWARPRRGMPQRLCAMFRDQATMALVTLSPARDGWANVADWAMSLPVLVPDREAGQAWLDASRAALAIHLAVGEARFGDLREAGRRLATLQAEDGEAFGSRDLARPPR